MNAMDVLDGVSSTDVVVVQGSGPLGLLATAAAKVAGASNRYPLDDVNTAIERMKHYQEIKPVIRPFADHRSSS